MDNLMKSIDKLLSALPFNGDKTTIGLALNFLVPVLAAKFPVLLLVSPLLEAAAQVLVGLGAAHKAVKSLRKEKK